MASTRAQQGTLITQAASNGFLNQVLGSLIAYSIGVFSEGTAVVNHANRLTYARAIAGAATSLATYMLPGYLSNANILAAAGTPASIADADVDVATAAVFNVYANQYATALSSGTPLAFGA